MIARVRLPRLVMLALLAACSSNGGSQLRVGHEQTGDVDGGNDTSGTAGTGAGKHGGTAGSSGSDALHGHVEDIAGLEIEVLTLACAGDCVDLQVVGGGGNPPYTFAWDDGSTRAMRHVCLDAGAELHVTITDTAITADEFSYAARSVTEVVSALVLDCSDAGTTEPMDPGTVSLCENGTTPPFQLIDAAPSLVTTSYAQTNGTLPDYTVDGVAVTIVGKWTKHVELGTCTKLLLSGDAAGQKPIGFDNFLIAELIATGAQPVRFYYGPAANIVHTPSGEKLPTPMAPSVPGTSIDPAIPNPVPFGYPALSVDLMTQVPAGTTTFELNLYVVDSGGFGSTSAIWVAPQ